MRLRQTILRFSQATEIVVVIAVAFGFFAIQSVLRLVQFDEAPALTALPLRYVIPCQVLLFSAIWFFLSIRGWRLKDLSERPRVIDVFLGIPLAVAGYLPFLLLSWLLMSPATDIGAEPRGETIDLSGSDLETLVAGALVNSAFEEVLVVGYLVTALRRRFGCSVAIHASAMIRLSYHVHLGSVAVISILPLGYIFAHWYNSRRSLLPIVTAHAILDVIAFSAFKIA
jgi:membrane protease YdiL (CAAX protease family)